MKAHNELGIGIPIFPGIRVWGIRASIHCTGVLWTIRSGMQKVSLLLKMLKTWLLHASTWQPCSLCLQSQNHRMAWLGRDCKDHQVPTPLLWTGLPATRSGTRSGWQPRSSPSLAMNNFRDGAPTAFLCGLCNGLTMLSVRSFPLAST